METTIIHGDCIEEMRKLDAESVDAVVCDPPYGLAFMGKEWDDYSPAAFQAWCKEWSTEALRVLKPGGHLLAFGGTRTYHRLASGIEDAGFEVRDCIAWVYGSGFPKSLDVSKAIDKAAGAEREDLGPSARHVSGKPQQRTAGLNGSSTFAESIGMGSRITAPATDAAKQWQGWGTALKPAHEPVVVARKPLAGTVAANVQEHGTGAINVDGCRVTPTGESRERVGEATQETRYTDRGSTNFAAKPGVRGGDPSGRWPANLVHDGSDEVLACFPDAPGQQGALQGGEPSCPTDGIYGTFGGRRPFPVRGDAGSAARFFYCAKPPGEERGKENIHPTVKPVDLMRWLVRLVTPPGGTVLDPFLGSGTTALACWDEEFNCIGIERETEYVEIAKARLARHKEPRGVDLATPSLFGDPP